VSACATCGGDETIDVTPEAIREANARSGGRLRSAVYRACPDCQAEPEEVLRLRRVEAAARELLEARKRGYCGRVGRSHDFTHTAAEFPFRRFCGGCGANWDPDRHDERRRAKLEEASARALGAALGREGRGGG
jgi:hypothetical protein